MEINISTENSFVKWLLIISAIVLLYTFGKYLFFAIGYLVLGFVLLVVALIVIIAILLFIAFVFGVIKQLKIDTEISN